LKPPAGAAIIAGNGIASPVKSGPCGRGSGNHRED